MLQNLELEKRWPIPATGKAAHPVLDAENHENATGHCDVNGSRRAETRTASGVSGCSRLARSGGSTQRFCSTGHRQAFWIAARRWTMRAVEAGNQRRVSQGALEAACTLRQRHSD